jgi:hypothetical protein
MKDTLRLLSFRLRMLPYAATIAYNDVVMGEGRQSTIATDNTDESRLLYDKEQGRDHVLSRIFSFVFSFVLFTLWGG